MSKLLYSLGIFLYQSLISVIAPFNTKARLRLKGTRNNHLIYQMMRNDPGLKVWFHAASLGEFEQARPLMEAYRRIHPDRRIVLSFFSPSGYEVRKNYSGADYIFYLPMDTPRNARKLAENIQPVEVFFIKYEFWYHILSEIQRNKIPLYLISGIFRKKQPFFRFYGSWFLQKIAGFTYLFVQNQISLDLLHAHGIKNCTLSGDTRFDRVAELITSAKSLPVIEQFKQEKRLVIAGSTWPPEEEMLSDWIKEMPEDWKLIIAPHEVNPEHITALRERFQVSISLYSEALAGKTISQSRILVIDNIGILTSIYSYGSIAVVGGAFKTGLHNVLEPAAYGIPVVFGPVYHKFDEAKGLLKANGGLTVPGRLEFLDALRLLTQNEEKRREMANSARQFVQNNRGAVEKILMHLNSSSQA